MNRWWWIAGLCLTASAWAGNSTEPFKEVPFDKLSSTEMSDWGTAALALQPGKWKHAETEHFILHFFRNGEKIARRSEAFYTEIKEFFGNRPDRLQGRKSQVFAFQEPNDWRPFATKIGQPWAAGVTRQDEFFYVSANEDGRFDSKGKIQAHEMTHLIFNRFYQGRPPLWLNEGVAEYFGQRKTSTLTQFRKQMGVTAPYPLLQLFNAERYPDRTEQIQAFYAEAAIVVDFLSHTSDRAVLLPKFVEAMIADKDVATALKLYGYKDWTEFEAAYKRYRKHF